MSDLFGSDSLFIDFDKQASSSEKPADHETIDLTEASDTDAPELKSPGKEKATSDIDNVVIKLPFGEFAIDRGAMKMPSDWPLVSSLAALGDRPTYSSTFRDFLAPPEPEESLDKPPPRPSRPKMTCFNCGGPHMLSSCKETKDYGKIAQKRREYNDANPPANRPTPSPQQQQPQQQQPYPGSDMNSGRVPPLISFDHFKPGVISHVLRQALGLYPNQIPPYVYILREVGYPPGWLEEAKIPLGPDEISDVPLFDSKKVVEYPGYNVPLPPETVDETRQFHVRRFDQRHSVKEMRRWMDQLQKHHIHRRNILAQTRKSESSSSQKSSHHAAAKPGIQGGEAAMDLDDTSGDEEAQFIEAGPATVDENSNSSSAGEAADLESLERERENLLRLLESTLSGNANTGGEIAGEEAGEEGPGLSSEEALNQSTPTLEKPSMSQSLGVSSGTPLPEAVGTPVSVPARERFAEGIGCHLPFQNLPEAVGTFERLKRVLAGVRKRQNNTGASSSGAPPESPTGPSSSLASSPQQSRRDDGNNRRGYVDYDTPNDDEPDRSRSRSRDNRRSQDNNNSGYRSSSSEHQSSSRGYHSEQRSSSHRYRPY